MFDLEDNNSLLTSSLPSSRFKEMKMKNQKNPPAFSWRKTLRSQASILNLEDKSSHLTSSIPSSVFSKQMEMKNSKNPTAFSWRKTLRSRASILNLEDKDSFLTSSLPSSVLSKQMELMSPKNITSQFSQNGVIESVDCRYTVFEGLPHQIIERSRRTSVQLDPVQFEVLKRKPLQNFARVCSPSTRFGRIQLNSSESNARICKVDDAFANIKSQLAQLSEGDVLLQERLECLTLEIASMQRCVDRKCYLPDVLTTTCVSHGQGEILTSPNYSSYSASAESCKDEEKDLKGSRKYGGRKSISNFLNLSNSAQGSYEPSLESCEPLTYSKGSLSLGQPSHYSVKMIKSLNPRPRMFSCEDNVFFT